MADDPSTPQDKQRIEVLEEEVARLKSKLGDLPPDDDEVSAEKVALPNRTKVIVIAVLAGLIALAGVIALVTGMSQVIDPFSKKAAKALHPFEADPTEPQPAPTPETKKQPPPEDLPRAPGL